MKHLTKRQFSKRIFFVTSIIFLSLIFSPNVNAQTDGSVESLSAQIEALLKTVSELQIQLLNIQPVSSNFISFNKNLRLGDRGDDVKQLQIFLNRDSRTRVANSGPGSIGNETTYFGNLTTSAVIKFQELHFDDVLKPVGLLNGTGYVGPSTRAKLNKLISDYNLSNEASEDLTNEDEPIIGETPVVVIIDTPINENTIEEEFVDETPIVTDTTLSVDELYDALLEEEVQYDVQGEIVFTDYDDVVIFFPSDYEATRGTVVNISGAGFTRENNTVHIGERTIDGIESLTGTYLEFTVPSDIPFGRYELFVSNNKGTTEQRLLFVVIENDLLRPTISSVTPDRGSYGQLVTITGTNFTAENNEILTSYGETIIVPSSDGTTIEFNVLPFPEVPELQVGVSLGLGAEVPLTFYIVDEHGLSEDFGTFILEL